MSRAVDRRSSTDDERVREVDVVAYDRALASSIDEHCDADLGYSEKIDPSRWRRRWIGQRALESGTALLRPWM